MTVPKASATPSASWGSQTPILLYRILTKGVPEYIDGIIESLKSKINKYIERKKRKRAKPLCYGRFSVAVHLSNGPTYLLPRSQMFYKFDPATNRKAE